MPQNADGTAHFTYFDEPTQLSFVWDGHSTHIEVCWGGYGEPVIDQIDLQQYLPSLFEESDEGGTPIAWLDWYALICRLYVESKGNSNYGQRGGSS